MTEEIKDLGQEFQETENNDAPMTSMAEAFEAALKEAEAKNEQPQEVALADEKDESHEEEENRTDSESNEESKLEEKEDSKLTPPNEWTQEEKDLFEEAVAKEELKPLVEKMKDRYGNLKKGFYKKAEELANEKKFSSQFREIFEPYEDALKKNGHTPSSYVKDLVKWDIAFTKDAPTAIKSLMEAFSVTPDKLGFSNDADYYENEETAQLRLENERLKKKIYGNSDLSKRNAENSAAEQIRDFKYSLNELGEPKYPLFDEVRHEMQIILNAGKAQTLEEAYNLSPTVREKELNSKMLEKEKGELESARIKAAKAKKMARSVKPSKTASSSGGAGLDFKAALAANLSNVG